MEIIRCLVALEGALGRVRTPPAAVAALRRGLVDTGVVVTVDEGDNWGGGGGGGGGDGGWRHFCLVGRSRSQVTLEFGGLVWRERRRHRLLIYPNGPPPQPVHPSTQMRTITSPALPSSS